MIQNFDFPDDDLTNTLLFVKEAGKLKSVIRQTHLSNEERFENSAEHSWHLTLLALCLTPIADLKLNANRILKMLVVHDLGEVYHGDTFLYDEKRNNVSNEERTALIKLLEKAPSNLTTEILEFWDEFEAQETGEAKFAQSLDRFQPFMEQLDNGGESWRRNKITYEKALEKNKHIGDGFPALWTLYKNLAAQANAKGFFYIES